MLLPYDSLLILSFSVLNSQLMAKEPLEKLGFKDIMDSPLSQAEKNDKPLN